MTSTETKMRTLGFFNPTDNSNTTKQPLLHAHLPDVKHDCFHALATSLIVYCTHNTPRGEWLKQLLTHHLNYFPQHQRPSPTLLTKQKEHVQWRLNHINHTELQSTLAYTLRQIAVDELCANPAPYFALFIQNPPKTLSPALLRTPSTPMGHDVLLALANALGLSIEVRCSAPEKSLPIRFLYPTHRASLPHAPHLILNMNQGRYDADISSQAQAALVQQENSAQLFSTQPIKHTHPTSDPSSLLIQHKQQMLSVFQKTYHQLTTMVQAKELQQADLFTMYIKTLNQQHIQYVGTEHGTTHFFQQLAAGSQAQDSPMETNHLTHALIHALARAVSTGQLEVDAVFRALDQNSAPPVTPKI